MHPLARFLRYFFHLLYHPFARAYDLVAWTVSLGRWNEWVLAVLPFIAGTRVLELGHGPGHLQRRLLDLNLFAVGIDESRQMGSLAKNRLSDGHHVQPGLVRAVGQLLPFPDGYFDSMLATFPAEYIFEERTLLEARRTLKDGGRLIVLPVAWITGKGLFDRLMAWVFRFTGQAPLDPVQEVGKQLKIPFEQVGFAVEARQVDVKSSQVLILVATK